MASAPRYGDCWRSSTGPLTEPPATGARAQQFILQDSLIGWCDMNTGTEPRTVGGIGRRRFVGLLFVGTTTPAASCTDAEQDASGNRNGTSDERPPPETGSGNVGSASLLREPFTADFTPPDMDAVTDEFEPFQTYEAPVFDYSLVYPGGWTVTRPFDVEPDPETPASGAVRIAEPAPGNAFVFVAPFDSEGGPDEFADFVLSERQSRELVSNVEVRREQEHRTQDGRPMLILELAYVVRENDVRETVGFVSAEFNYAVSVFASAVRYTQPLNEAANRIVESFQSG